MQSQAGFESGQIHIQRNMAIVTRLPPTMLEEHPNNYRSSGNSIM